MEISWPKDPSNSPIVPATGIAVVLVVVAVALLVAEHPSSATFWIGVGAVCSGLAAIATAVLALFTFQMAKKTSAEATATVQLVDETRKDRQQLWQPQLEMLVYNRNMGGVVGRDYGNFDLHVRNSGSAPALQVVIVARDGEAATRWAVVKCGDLRPGEDYRAAHMGSEGGPFLFPFAGTNGADVAEYVAVVVLCRDVLGRRLRFSWASIRWPDGGPNPNDFPGLRPLPLPDIEEGAHLPRWATAPELWANSR